MKKIIFLVLMTTLCVAFMACGNEKNTENNKTLSNTTVNDESNKKEIQSDNNVKTDESTTKEKNILVVYFSATGNTKIIAESIADGLSADIYEIVPEKVYTDADLDYSDNNSRSTKEMNDSSARPKIAGTVENFGQYDIVFLGYPIWWGDAPRILDTFVESYDFTGKTVIPFCTSASSEINSSAHTLEKLAGSGKWMDGQRFSKNDSDDKVIEWASQFK